MGNIDVPKVRINATVVWPYQGPDLEMIIRAKSSSATELFDRFSAAQKSETPIELCGSNWTVVAMDTDSEDSHIIGLNLVA